MQMKLLKRCTVEPSKRAVIEIDSDSSHQPKVPMSKYSSHIFTCVKTRNDIWTSHIVFCEISRRRFVDSFEIFMFLFSSLDSILICIHIDTLTGETSVVCLPDQYERCEPGPNSHYTQDKVLADVYAITIETFLEQLINSEASKCI